MNIDLFHLLLVLASAAFLLILRQTALHTLNYCRRQFALIAMRTVIARRLNDTLDKLGR